MNCALLGAEGIDQLLFHAGQREMPVAVAREVGGRRFAAADHRAGAPFEHFRQRLGAGADHQVAAEDGMRFAGGDARGMDVFRPVGDAQVREDGAEFLRQPGHVEGGDALAVEVGGHADQRAEGDDAHAADAGDQQVVGMGGGRQGGGGQKRPVFAVDRARSEVPLGTADPFSACRLRR